MNRKECLRDMIYKIYSHQTVYYKPPDSKNNVEIILGGKSDLTTICTYTPKYKDKFITLLEYTFIPQKKLKICVKHGDVIKDDEISNEKFVKNVLINFVGIEAIKEVLAINRKSISLVGTTDPLLDVLENDDEYNRIIVCCNEEELERFNQSEQIRKSVWDKMDHSKYSGFTYYDSLGNSKLLSVSSEQNEKTSVTENQLAFVDFCSQYKDIFPDLAKYICHILIDFMLPVLFLKIDNEAISEKDDTEAMYKEACQKFKERIYQQLCSYVIKKTRPESPIVVIDDDYNIEKINSSISIGSHFNNYLVGLWNVPTCKYIIYNDDPLIARRIFQIPVLKEQMCRVKKSSDMIREIEYLTYIDEQEKEHSLNLPSKERFSSYRERMNDIIENIIIRYSHSIKKYWEAVMQSIEEILKKIFSIDLSKLIWEKPIDKEEGLLWLRNFNQTAETLEEYYPGAKEVSFYDSKYYYYIKNEQSIDKVMEELADIRKIASIILPVIAEFADNLCGERIAGGMKRARISNSKVRDHHKVIEDYLNCEKLKDAVDDWDKTYASWIDYRETQIKQANETGKGWENDGRLRTLVEINNSDEDAYGNIFKNLQEALENYSQFLMTDFTEEDYKRQIGLGVMSESAPF